MTQITSNIHSIDGLDILFPGHKVVPYLLREDDKDLTLIDTCYIKELPKLESYVVNAGYKMSDIKRIILTHVHSDHAQAANEVKRRTSTSAYDDAAGGAKILVLTCYGILKLVVVVWLSLLLILH